MSKGFNGVCKVELEKIIKLMSAMEERGIKALALKEEGGFELELEREHLPHGHTCVEHEKKSAEAPTVQHKPKTMPSESTPLQEQEEEDNGEIITSPMVGTFYLTPSPGEPPLVKEGDKVSEDTVVCIIEAMKVMNEVKAGIAGTIDKIFSDNAHPVEFGTKLFRIV